MVRLVHTADVHLGGGSAVFGHRADAHQRLIREAFARVIDLAIARQADALLIAGDLFDRRLPTQRGIGFAVVQLQRLLAARPEAHVFVLPGTHDCVSEGGFWHSGSLQGISANVHCFAGPGVEYIELPALGLAVHGRGQQCHEDRHEPLGDMKPREGLLNVALAHGSVLIPEVTDSDSSLIKLETIQSSGMNYIALGHWHSPYGAATGAVTAWYSGSPEILSIGQPAAGYALAVELEAGAPARVEQVKTGVLGVRREGFDAAELAGEEDLASRVGALAGEHTIMDVTLSGIAPPGFAVDIEHLMEELEKSFFRLGIKDKSQLPVDITGLAEEQIAGRFVALMRERLAGTQAAGDERGTRVVERALQLGVALLDGKKVLS